MTLAVQFTQVSRLFGEVKAVDRVSIDIQDGEFFSMLGPSGSGKTTCLRLIAGFEQPSSGSIRIHGEAAGLPPYQRDVNTVFQDYALFPMNVRDNVAYGLKVKGVGKSERLNRAEEALGMVALAGYGDRKPAQLSGGQRQRVALARALVNRPRAAAGRAPGRTGPEAARADAERAEEAAAPARHHLHLRHPRPERSAVDVRPRGGVQQGPHRAGRHPAQPLHAAGHALRRRVRRHLQRAARRRGEGADRQRAALLHPPRAHPLRHRRAALAGEVQISGLLHDIQYQGAATRYELRLDNGQNLCISQANNQWQAAAPSFQPGERITVRWAREAMVQLSEGV